MKKGVTLVELMIVIAVIGVLMIAVQPYFYTLRRAWEQSDRNSDILQNARIGLDKMVREVRQAKSFTSVTAASDINGRLVFVDKNNNTVEFKRYNDGTNNMLGYVTGATTYPLAGPIDSLKFTCYKTDALTATTVGSEIKRVDIELVTADIKGKLSAQTLASKIYFRVDPAASAPIIVVNEIMFNPKDSLPGNEDNTYEYVELYNTMGSSIDVAGWTLTDESNFPDTLSADAAHGGSTTIIPAGGYAIITDTDTKAYDGGSPYTIPPAAIRLRVGDTAIGNGLNNVQDMITIKNSGGTIVDSVYYLNSWGSGGANGLGDSLERISPSGGSNDPANWKDSPLNGTPGSVNL